MTTYSKATDIRDQYVLPTIAGFEQDFDIDGIVDDIIARSEWTNQGYIVDIDDETFVEILQANDITSN